MSKAKKKNNRNSNKEKKAYINQSVCDRSPFCPVKRVCPVNAVEKKGFFGGEITINKEKCIGCSKCVAYCPHHAVSMR